MEAIIDIRSISFSYPQSKRLVLNDCSLQIMAGEITSFLGPNGAGKSTLLNCACGLLRPQSGDIYLNEKSIWTMKQAEIAKVVGYVQQYQNSSFAHSVFDYVLMGRASNISFFSRMSCMQSLPTARIFPDWFGVRYCLPAFCRLPSSSLVRFLQHTVSNEVQQAGNAKPFTACSEPGR